MNVSKLLKTLQLASQGNVAHRPSKNYSFPLGVVVLTLDETVRLS